MAIQIDLGKIKLTNRGTYDAATAYAADDIVQFTDSGVVSSYICKAASTGNNPSSAGVEHASWAFLAKGTDAVGMAWNAVQTADFTASSANGYHVDTSGGGIAITLPASPSEGDEIRIVDTTKSFHLNMVSLLRNGSNIEGIAEDWNFWCKGTDVLLSYETTRGWLIVSYTDDMQGDRWKSKAKGQGSKKYMITTSDAEEVYLDGDYCVHKFLSSGTWTVHSVGTDGTFGNKIEYLCVGGGGAGGAHHGSGAGAGGYRANNAYDYVVTPQAYAIAVGAGGAEHGGTNRGSKGSDTTFDGMNSEGGGAGGGGSHTGGSGGSGGGGAHSSGHGNATGNGTGHRGGNHQSHTGGGGGGASREGADQYGNHQAGHGGRGTQNDITGIQQHYAGGGGANGHNHTSHGTGGIGGGGDGCGGWGEDGTGGGGGGQEGPNGGHKYAGKGGDGIVVIRYKCKD